MSLLTSERRATESFRQSLQQILQQEAEAISDQLAITVSLDETNRLELTMHILPTEPLNHSKQALLVNKSCHFQKLISQRIQSGQILSEAERFFSR